MTQVITESLIDSAKLSGGEILRLDRVEAQRALAREMETALQSGNFNKAGLAALKMIEELDHLAPEALIRAYEMASIWLAEDASLDLLLRVNNAAKKVLIRLGGTIDSDEALEILLRKNSRRTSRSTCGFG